MEDVAGYADDPAREREVLEDYGYRYGWERFWGDRDRAGDRRLRRPVRAPAPVPGPTPRTSPATTPSTTAACCGEDPPDLPGGCRLLTVDEPEPDAGLSGPAALRLVRPRRRSASAVTAVADSVDAAEEEVRAVLAEQLDRLPPR